MLCLDGLPIGGSVSRTGRPATTSSGLASREALSPGTLMTWLPIQSALATRRSQFNMLPDFSYYKARWLAETIETETMQLFRVGSRYHLKAILSTFRGRILKGNRATKVLANPYKEAAGKAATPAEVDRARIDALVTAARAAGATELDGAALKALQPVFLMTPDQLQLTHHFVQLGDLQCTTSSEARAAGVAAAWVPREAGGRGGTPIAAIADAGFRWCGTRSAGLPQTPTSTGRPISTPSPTTSAG